MDEFVSDSVTNLELNAMNEEIMAFNAEQNTQSDAVSKFMNGEISFSDYLKQMDEISIQDEQSDVKIDSIIPDVDSMDIGSIDDFSESDYSESSLSDDDEQKKAAKESNKTKVTRKKRVRRSKLSPTLRAMMGQANVYYAKGDTESAVKICLEIIKEEPNASEPFRTLASIYEGIGQPEKSIQMRLIAAHLGPTSKEEWTQIASIMEAAGKLRQAVMCLTRALKVDELNVALYEKRYTLMKLARLNTGEDYGYHRLLHKLVPEKDGATVLRIRTLVASLYLKDKKYEKACETLKYIFDVCEKIVNTELVESYTDALVHAKNYAECLSILCKFSGISVVKKEDANGEERIVDATVPVDASVNIRFKVILCFTYYKAFDLLSPQISIVLKDDPDVYGQFFYDSATFLVAEQRYSDALLMLKRLTDSKMNSADIWFKITDCYKQLDRLEECFASYRIALRTFPDDNELKLKFCDELKSAGLYEEAVEVTLKDESNIGLLIYRRCQLYYILEDFDAFIESALEMFRLHSVPINSLDDFSLFQSIFRMNKGVKEKLGPHLSSTMVDNSVSLEDEWQVFAKVCQLYIDRKDYDLFQHLAFSLWLSLKFIPKRPELRLSMTIACMLNNDHELGFDLGRSILFQYESSDQIWNLFLASSYRGEYTRMHKFLIRYLIKKPDDNQALLMFANSCLFAGTYKYALNDYTILFEKCETPMLALLIAVSLLHMSCQKFTNSKHILVTQMMAFFTKYEELRGSDASQEIYYNVGRALHQLDLLPQAIFYYKKALSCKPAIEGTMFDLSPDIAYNLHLIYLNADQPVLATSLLRKYVVI